MIRCPTGWTPVGPYCTAVLSVFPYTECPYTKRRYLEPYIATPAFVSPVPGVCVSQEGTGVIARCPEGLTLELNPLDTLPERVLKKTPKKKIIMDPTTKSGAKLKEKYDRGLDLMERLHAAAPARRLQPNAANFTISAHEKTRIGELPVAENGSFTAKFLAGKSFVGKKFRKLQSGRGQRSSEGRPMDDDESGKRDEDEDEDQPDWSESDSPEIFDDPRYKPNIPNVDAMDEDLMDYQRISEYRCVGTDQRVYSPSEWEGRGKECPRGYTIRTKVTPNTTLWPDGEDTVICEGYPVLPPEPFCPPGFRQSALDYNPTNILAIRSLHCVKDTRYKGRLWCPDTFMIDREPYAGLPYFSEVAPADSLTIYDPLLYSRVGYQMSAPTRCIRAVSVPATQCDEYKCKDPILTELGAKIKKFGYFRLKRDPFYIKFDSLPSGKDILWSPGRFFPA